MTRPGRSFQSLLLQALVEAKAGDLGALQAGAFREEVERHLAMGPREENPIGRALYLGREALHHLSLGEREEACAKLLQALRLHPYLGGGYARALAEVLCGERTAEEGSRRGDRTRLEQARPEVRLLAFLDALPPAFWVEVFWPKEKRRAQAEKQGPRAAWEARASLPRPERRPPSPSRPRFPLVYRPRYREEPREEGVQKMLLITSFKDDKAFGYRELRRWVGPGLEIREEEEGDFRLRLFPEFWERHPGAALLVLEGREARVLTPLLPNMPLLPFPPTFRRGEEVVGEVWSWEDMTPRTLAAFLREARYHRELFEAWLVYGVGTGRLDRKTLLEALRLLRGDR